MNKTLTILKTEFINTVSRRSFLITLILVPLLPALILGGVSLFGDSDSEGTTDSGGIFQPPAVSPLPEGYVDQAGIITELPEWLGPENLVAFATEDEAKEALLAGEISGYNVIPADILETGAVRFVNEEFNPFSNLEGTNMIDGVIRYNLLGADPTDYSIYSTPIQVSWVDLAPETVERDMSNPLSFYLPMA